MRDGITVSIMVVVVVVVIVGAGPFVIGFIVLSTFWRDVGLSNFFQCFPDMPVILKHIYCKLNLTARQRKGKKWLEEHRDEIAVIPFDKGQGFGVM